MPQPLNWTPDLSQPLPGSDAALALGWAWPAARAACDEHKRGSFSMSWQLWTDVDSLPSIRAAKMRRRASPCGLPWEVVGPTRAPGRIETEAARALWERHVRRLLKSTLDDVMGMGFSVWQHPTAVNPATMRREVITVERFPLSQVRFTSTPFPDVWNPGKWIQGYYAIQFGIGESLGAVMYGPQTLRPTPAGAYVAGGNGVWVRFVQLPRPGETDGHWTLIADPLGADQPHLSGAVTALDVSYVGGAILTRSMYALSKTLGRQGIYGEEPPSTPVQGADDGMSQEGKAMRRLVAGFGTAEADGVIPSGAKLAAVSLTSQTAGLFPEFCALNLRDVELAILGHAGTMAKGDAQYQPKDGAEIKVPQHLERADVRTIRSAFEGLINLLAEENAGVAGIELLDHLPNTEEDERISAIADRMTKVAAIIKAEGDAGCAVTQERATQIAEALRVSPPTIAARSPARILAWHVEQKIVAPDQVLESLGLPALPADAGSVVRLAAERLSGKDASGKPASLGDATVDAAPPDVPPGAAPAPQEAPVAPAVAPAPPPA